LATRTSGKRDERLRKSTRGDASSPGGKRAGDGKKSRTGKSLGGGKSGKDERKKKKSKKRVANASRANGDTDHAGTSRGWAVLAELLGRRAGMRVVWELNAGPLKFRALQAACDDLSPSTLNQRLADLKEARLVALEERQGYRLTPQGEELARLLGPLAGWAEGWSHRRAQTRHSEGPPRKRARIRNP
jgi:DNA-binding HxlR family transcriptional regulator